VGIGLVIILHLIAIGFLSGLIAVAATIITYFSGKKETRKRNIRTAVITPFAALYTLYICGLIGFGIVSWVKKVDIGIGDTRYIPLPDNCQLLFIDLPDQAYIKKNGQPVISDVAQLQQNDNKISGKTARGKYFTYNTTTNKLKEYTSEKDFNAHNPDVTLSLSSAFDFYADTRQSIAGIAFIVVGIISIFVGIAAAFLARKSILRWTKPT